MIITHWGDKPTFSVKILNKQGTASKLINTAVAKIAQEIYLCLGHALNSTSIYICSNNSVIIWFQLLSDYANEKVNKCYNISNRIRHCRISWKPKKKNLFHSCSLHFPIWVCRGSRLEKGCPDLSIPKATHSRSTCGSKDIPNTAKGLHPVGRIRGVMVLLWYCSLYYGK